MSNLKSSILNSLNNAELVHQPFSYYKIKDVFPEDFYQSLRENLPKIKDLEELKHHASKRQDSSYARRILEIREAKDLNKIPKEIRGPWKQIWELGNDPDYQKKIIEMFAPSFNQRFKGGVKKREITVKMVISRDLDQYQIQVHPDTARKVATMQFYIPEDDSLIDHGTVMYQKIPKELRQENQRYQRVDKMKFARNSGYGFAVNDRSFHAVDLMRIPKDQSRDSVTLLFMGTDKTKPKDRVYQKELKRGKPAS